MVIKKKLVEVEEKLGGVMLKLAQVESLTLTQVDEITDLKATLDAAEETGYD